MVFSARPRVNPLRGRPPPVQSTHSLVSAAPEGLIHVLHSPDNDATHGPLLVESRSRGDDQVGLFAFNFDLMKARNIFTASFGSSDM